MDPIRFSNTIHLLVRAAAELHDIRPAMTPRGLRYLRDCARRRKEVAGILLESVSAIESAVNELRALWNEEEVA